MCWFIDVVVVPVKAAAAHRIAMPRLPGPEALHGSRLAFSYQHHHCACDVVARRRFAGLAAAVAGFCRQPEVKRVEVRQRWADRDPTAPSSVAVRESEFVGLCGTGGAGLEAEVLYRISPDRFHRGGPAGD